ncbi:hypothetical protein [Micromonospora thermarum]|nr:hypothetical protein [Micromonospora thermarum]
MAERDVRRCRHELDAVQFMPEGPLVGGEAILLINQPFLSYRS